MPSFPACIRKMPCIDKNCPICGVRQDTDRVTPLQEKIEKALGIACRYGQIDGDHHKMWTLDQMVRALTGCPMVMVTKKDCRGVPYTFEAQGESEEYLAFVKEHNNDDEDGPGTYEWDIGIPP